MTDEKADELIEALRTNTSKVNDLNNNIDSLYELLKQINIDKELKHIKNQLDNITGALDH